jgi:hypothetical protein
MDIIIKVPEEVIKQLNNKYSKEEIEIIAKNLLLDWCDYKKKNDYETYQIKESIQQLQQVTKDIFGLSKTSQKRGEIGENMIYNIFQNDYQNYSFEKTNHVPHSADAIVTTPNSDKFLLEIKNYQNVIDQKEINKLKYDMEYTNINYALFISIQSGIVGKKTIDIEKFIINNNSNNSSVVSENSYQTSIISEDSKKYSRVCTIVYCSYIFEEPHKLHSCITLLESLIKIKNENYNYFKDEIIETIKDITEIYDIIKNLNSQYLIVENNIKEQLSNFYLIIRDYQIKIKNKINKISKKIDDMKYITSDEFIDNFNESECILQINKINDIIIDNDLKIIKKDDSSWIIVIAISNNTKNIGEIKKFKSKIEVSIYNPNICIKFLSKDKSDENYILLNTIIKQNII